MILRRGNRGAKDACSICGEQFDFSKIDLQKHERACIAKMPLDKVKPCPTCGGYFKLAKGGLNKHMKFCKISSKRRPVASLTKSKATRPMPLSQPLKFIEQNKLSMYSL
jgi:hypothetical protein